jgi:hypothetical protein
MKQFVNREHAWSPINARPPSETLYQLNNCLPSLRNSLSWPVVLLISLMRGMYSCLGSDQSALSDIHEIIMINLKWLLPVIFKYLFISRTKKMSSEIIKSYKIEFKNLLERSEVVCDVCFSSFILEHSPGRTGYVSCCGKPQTYGWLLEEGAMLVIYFCQVLASVL